MTRIFYIPESRYITFQTNESLMLLTEKIENFRYFESYKSATNIIERFCMGFWSEKFYNRNGIKKPCCIEEFQIVED
jgi:hypothetical protein